MQLTTMSAIVLSGNPGLNIILAAKIVVTAILWSLPLLIAPRKSARLLGIPDPSPIIFVYLLGAAYTALLVGYVFGLISLTRGQDILNVIWVGIVSNGLAFILLLLFHSEWKQWPFRARLYMWGSTALSFVITAGLVLFGLVFTKAQG
jgi:hypothetical protein